MKKTYKTLKNKDFKEIYEKGEKFVGSFFLIFLLSNQNELQIGFVASKKIGNAIKRNRAKRIMREIVRLNENFLPHNIHMALVARKNILYGNFSDINNSFLHFANNFLKQNES